MTQPTRPSSSSLRPHRSFLLSACLLAALAGGCGGESAAEQALRRATLKLDALSIAGSTPMPSEVGRKAVYNDVLTNLRSFADAPEPGEAAAANLLIARAHAGMGEIASQHAAEAERRFLSQLTTVTAALDQWVSQNSVADALSLYDPAKDLADLDRQIADRAKEAEAMQAEKARQETVVQDLQSRAEQALQASKSERARETSIRLQADLAGVSQTARYDLVQQAAQAGRAADAKEKESAFLQAEAASQSPRIGEIQRQIDRLRTQAQLLAQAKTDISARKATATQQAEAARAEAAKAAQSIEAILTAIAAARDAATTPTDEAVKAYTAASASAKKAASGAAGRDHKLSANTAAGSYQQSLGDVQAARARSLASYAAALSLLAKHGCRRAQDRRRRRRTAAALPRCRGRRRSWPR